MAWFGDTFGDGLSSLKGQITKITKEVLSEDPLATTSYEGRIKELEQACSKYIFELEKLQNENKRLKEGRNFELSDDQIQNLCQFENKLSEVTAEKEALTKALDEIDLEHQKELEVVIKERNYLRDIVNKSKYDSRGTNNDEKIEALNTTIAQLQLQNDILSEENNLINLKIDQKPIEKRAEHDEVVISANSRLEDEINRLNQVIIESEMRLKSLDGENELIKSVILELKSQNIVKDQTIETLETNLLIVQKDHQSLLGQYEELLKENKKILNRNEELSKENVQLLANIDHINSENEKITFELQTLSKENQKNLEELKILKNDATNKDEETYANIEKIKLENCTLQEKCHQLETSIRFLEASAEANNLNVEKNKLMKESSEKVEDNTQKEISADLLQKLNEAESLINNLMIESQAGEDIQLSFTKLTEDNIKLQSRVNALVEDSAVNLQELKEENCTLKKNLNSVLHDNSVMIECAKKENVELKRELETLKNNIVSWESLKNENSELRNQLQESHGNIQLLDNLTRENEILKEKLQKLEAFVASTEEVENLVSGSLGLEIRKLKELVSRIRNKFLRFDVNSELASEIDSENYKEENAGDVLTQCQTDDVKRLQQDVCQMTEIIHMIDQGLTTIYQDKSRLEKELAVLQSVATRTEQELSTASKALQQSETKIKEWTVAVSSRDELIQSLTTSKNVLENELVTCKNEKDNLDIIIRAKSEQINKLESDFGALQVELQEANSTSDEWKKRLKELQEIYQNDAKRAEELCNKKDELITELTIKLRSNENLKESFVNEELGSKCPEEASVELAATNNQHSTKELEDQISRLLNENADLKILVQQLRENIFAMNTRVVGASSEYQQQRKLQSQEEHKAENQVEHARYQSLLAEYQAIAEKEANLRREVERLRGHLVEVEEHYTEETMAAETELADYRGKLAVAEEQLRSSSTVFKSANVRSTQHVEALQTQIQLMDVQRKDLLTKLSDAEDQAQKQAAALASLQLVLEQFQLDKQRELQAVDEKYGYQIHLERRRATELEQEIDNIKQQLTEAKNGLKAAQRLGEQLDKKSTLITELEEELKKTRLELSASTNKLSNISQSTSGKIDKSLVKNLVVGYLSTQGDQKTQALKILTSVLEFNADERVRVGVEGQVGWLSHLFHPSAASAPPTESLSQAFVRFLESESRPQPQLKLLTEPQVTHPAKRAPLLLSDLVLPPVTPTEVSDPGLGSVLKES